MILLLGASGYIGQAFARELRRRRWAFIPLTRRAIDYTQFPLLFDYMRKMGPEFVINAAGYTGRPNVDGCELARSETLHANTLLPQIVARACLMTNTPWGHVSTGSIYRGAKLLDDTGWRVVTDLNQPEVRRLIAEHPERLRGFSEQDPPNFSFLAPPCSFYSGTKALTEETIQGVGRVYLWRPRLPFNERDESRNHLSKLQRYPKVYDSVNSMSHLEEFVRAGLDLWERRAPYGTYNLTNPGAVSARQIVEMIQRVLKPSRRFEFWKDDEEFYRQEARAPRSNCILDVSKLLATGVRMRPVEDAIEESLWKWEAAATAPQFPRREYAHDVGR